jgi:peroxiredoxin
MINVGEKIPNVLITLVDGRKVELSQLLQRGPVILNFIMGTWCPFCDNHLKKVVTGKIRLNKKQP